MYWSAYVFIKNFRNVTLRIIQKAMPAQGHGAVALEAQRIACSWEPQPRAPAQRSALHLGCRLLSLAPTTSSGTLRTFLPWNWKRKHLIITFDCLKLQGCSYWHMTEGNHILNPEIIICVFFHVEDGCGETGPGHRELGISWDDLRAVKITLTKGQIVGTKGRVVTAYFCIWLARF